MAHIAARGRFERSLGTSPRVNFSKAAPHPRFSSFFKYITDGLVRASNKFIVRFHGVVGLRLLLTLALL
jgi:hypothetical protein